MIASTLTLAAADPLDHVLDTVLLRINGVPVITMHMVTLLVVAVLFVFAMLHVARSIATGPESQGNERFITKGRFAQLIETIICYLRDEVLVPLLGEDNTRRYMPFLFTAFFFVLFNNLFGLIPIIDLLHLVHLPAVVGGTATSNLAITAGLAFVAFIVIQIHGFRDNGVKGWILHNFGGLVPGPIALLPIALLLFVVELLGHIIKPVALAIRLFANMLAGHTLMAVLFSFGAMAAKGGVGLFGVFGVSVIAGLGAVAITFLELFVAFLQAFIFMFLTSVFISLISHHDDHEHDEEHGHQHEHGQPAHA